jgi:hypothetical protein
MYAGTMMIFQNLHSGITLMRNSLLFGLLVVVACGGSDVIAPPPPPVDPPALVHAVNLTDQSFEAWLIIVGADALHSGLADQGAVAPSSQPDVGVSCLATGSVPGERRFVYAAVSRGSALDHRLNQLSAGIGDPAADAFRDSLSKNQINLTNFLAANPGLVAQTGLFDPAAPTGFGPTDPIPYTWTVSAPSTNTIVVNTSDHACKP